MRVSRQDWSLSFGEPQLPETYIDGAAIRAAPDQTGCGSHYLYDRRDNSGFLFFVCPNDE